MASKDQPSGTSARQSDLKAAQLKGETIDSWKNHIPPEHQMPQEDVQDLLRNGKVMYLTHLTKDGWPMVTPMFYCMLGDEIYTSTVKGRVKEKAYRRDNRISASLSREDLTLVNEQALTIKGRAEIIEDREIVRKVVQGYVDKYWSVFPKDVQERYFNTLYTKDRVAVRIVPEKIITWDVGRMQSREG
jgi:nitroimidazol reductase NimA-like FMN-containing flavoprotein (pyridoxamine 5'-phosphate oxidase superfamily)